jgi:hypothetical protein
MRIGRRVPVHQQRYILQENSEAPRCDDLGFALNSYPIPLARVLIFKHKKDARGRFFR